MLHTYKYIVKKNIFKRTTKNDVHISLISVTVVLFLKCLLNATFFSLLFFTDYIGVIKR